MPTTTATLRRALSLSWLLVSMLASIAFVLIIAVWSAARERADSLADYSKRQALLASALSADFEERLSEREVTTGQEQQQQQQQHDHHALALDDRAVLDLLAGARRVESPDLIVMVARPNADGFLATDHRIIPSTRLRAAVDAGEHSIILARDEAAAFGLPRRTAVAGLARVSNPKFGDWGLVVLSSAQGLRDRQILEERRLAVTVIIVTLVVAAFGGVARRRQRNELELERRIAVSTLEREREVALAKADKMAALAALSTGIAHEVGTPLGVIVGRVEQVLERAPPEDQRAKAALNVVLEQVDRIRRIVSGCLALARGDAPLLVQTSPASLVSHATDLVRHRFDNAGVELECNVEPDIMPVACEPALFEQALVNVLLNACEATPRGGTVRLSVEAVESDEVRFVVDDTGAGIPESVARRATEPFFSTRLKEGGSGLGLTIAREIVNHHSGALTIEKREGGRGTRATISVTARRS